MLAKINKIKSWQAALVIATIGTVVFFTGLTSPFQGDDQSQIVNNIPVHSITNIRLFFEGGTFYNGKGLSGVFYRPLMTTTFSLLYTLFGPHTLYFHLFQLILCIGSAILLYLVFRYSFKPVLSLILSLVFLVHPLNSQVVYAIPSMQDALFFFFGILALWLLLRFKSIRSLWLVAICLFLSMLSKEMGMVFVLLSLLYLFWFNRQRIYAFAGIMVIPFTLYLVLKINAVGLAGKSNIAPIDKLSLAGRLMTIPSMLLFYITKFIFPWKLATGYYWVYPTFSIRHVLLPLLIDLVVLGCVVYMGILIKRRVPKAQYYTYLFFAVWAAIGVIPYLQILPLDMTACETWFYFSMAGVLGMIGVALGALRVNLRWILIVGVVFIGLFGVRGAIRGLDYRNQYTLADKNISASPDDYIAYNVAAASLNEQGNFVKAKKYASLSVSIYPTYVNYNNLGAALTNLGDYTGAIEAYSRELKYGTGDSQVYENIGGLTLVGGKFLSNKQYLLSALTKFPHDSILWEYLAIIEERGKDNQDAKISIQNAADNGQVNQNVYNDILNDKPFALTLDSSGKSIGKSIEVP